MIPCSPLIRYRNIKASARKLQLAIDSNSSTPTPRRLSTTLYQSLASNSPIAIENVIKHPVLTNYSKCRQEERGIYPNVEKSVTIQPLFKCKANNSPVLNFNSFKPKRVFLLPTNKRKAKKEKKYLSITMNTQHTHSISKEAPLPLKSRVAKRTKTEKAKEILPYMLIPKHMSDQLRKPIDFTKTIFTNTVISSETKRLSTRLKETSDFKLEDMPRESNCFNQLKSIVNDYLMKIETSGISQHTDREINVNSKYKELQKELRFNEACVKKIVGNLKRKQRDNDEFLRLKFNINKKVVKGEVQ